MAHSLTIPPCIRDPADHHHPPPTDKSLRIQIEGPLVSVQKLLPDVPWHLDMMKPVFPQAAAPKLAVLAYRAVYGPNASPDDEARLVVKDENLGYIYKKNEIDYYGVTFDNNVPTDEHFPEVLQINIIEIEFDNGEYANEVLPFAVDPNDYIGKSILATPRCCQKRKGTTDRVRVNGSVAERDALRQGMDWQMMRNVLIGHGVYSTKIPELRCDPVPRPPTKKD